MPAIKRTERKIIGIVCKKAAKKAETAVLGRFLGRLVPGVGWGLLTWDMVDNRKEIKAFTDDVRRENEENRNNLLWHVR